MADIKEVAANHITDLFEDRWCHMFRLDLPAGETLADHDTGPRVIVLLTALKGRRVADGSEVKAAQGQAMYLDNTCAGAMTNTGADLAYLVLSFKQTTHHSLSWPQEQPGCQATLRVPQCLVWQVLKTTSVSVPVKVLHYRASAVSVLTCEQQHAFQASPGDVLLALAGHQ